MKIFGISGAPRSGKTALLKALVQELAGRGLRVSALLEAAPDYDLDRPGKDSFRHREAGASEVMISSAYRWSLMREQRDGAPPRFAELLSHLNPVDLLLVEGFDAEAFDRLAICPAGAPAGALPPRTVAVAGDPQPGLPALAPGDIPALADFILDHCGLARERRGVA